ncbi:UNVERIFIED_CONTAM: hypothetical protein FKN15_073919 [Acipenser sinensis]
MLSEYVDYCSKMDENSPRYQTVAASCPECGRRVSQNRPFTVVRISEGEMESYHHFLGMCCDLETTAKLICRICFSHSFFLLSCFSLEAASIGFIIVIDRRRDKWSAVKASLTRIAGAFPGNLQLVLVLRPSRFIQRTIADIGMKLHRDDFKMKAIENFAVTVKTTAQIRAIYYRFYLFQIIMLNSVSDLHGYIDKNQLTCELGGTLDYCHNQWIHHRTATENFAVTVKTTAQMLQMFGTNLAETELPNDVHCTEDLLVSHTEKHDKLRDELQLALKQGTTILSCIKERAIKNTSYKLNHDELENVATVERLLAQLDETENAFEQFWAKHHLKLEQCLQLRHFEQDFREVKLALDSLVETLAAFTDIGDSVSRVEQLLKELKVLEEKAQVKLALDSLVETLAAFTDIGDSVSRVEQLLKELKVLEEKAQVGNTLTIHCMFLLRLA